MPLRVTVERVDCPLCGSPRGSVEARGKDYIHCTSSQVSSYQRCSDCDHLYLNPRPAISEIETIYPNSYSTFTKRFGQPESWLAKIKDKALLGRFAASAGRLPETMSLLDIGCGDGRFLMTLRKRYPKGKLFGLDWCFGPSVAEEMAAARIETIVGAVESVDLPASGLDVITMNQLIEHVWDVRLVLDRCRGGLKPGGILAIETPNPDGWDRRFFRRGSWGGYYWPRHLNLFSRQHLSRLVAECGMEVELCQSLLAPPCWIYSCQFSMQRAGVRGKLVKSILPDTSTLLLGAFAVLDRLALFFGAETSN